MTSSRYWSGLLLLAALAGPAPAEDKKDAVKAADPKEAKEKLISSGALLGKLTALDPDNRTLTVQVTLQYLVPNDEGVATQADLRSQLADALQIEDPAERAQRVQEIRAAMLANLPNLVRVEEQQQDVPLQAAEEVNIRVSHPPPVFDDKGNPRKYTAAELKELRGPNPKIPGYAAAFADLKEGQIVRVLVARKKLTAQEIKDLRKAGQEPPLLGAIVVIEAQPDE
jgi:hypothetical protein